MTVPPPGLFLFQSDEALEKADAEVLRRELKRLENLHYKLAHSDPKATMIFGFERKADPEPTPEELRSLIKKKREEVSSLFNSLGKETRAQLQESEKQDIPGLGTVSIKAWGGLVLLALQIYFFLHLNTLSRAATSQQDQVWNVPWFGLYKDFLATTVFFLSTIALPVVAAATLIVAMVFDHLRWGLHIVSLIFQAPVAFASLIFQVTLAFAIFFAWRKLLRSSPENTR